MESKTEVKAKGRVVSVKVNACVEEAEQINGSIYLDLFIIFFSSLSICLRGFGELQAAEIKAWITGLDLFNFQDVAA